MAREAEFRSALARGVVGATVPGMDLTSLVSKSTLEDLTRHAIPSLKRLLDDCVDVLDTPKKGLLGMKKTKAENLKGEDKENYEACFKGIDKEDIQALKAMLRSEINLHTVSIAYAFLETILKMGDRPVACGPFKSQLKSVLEEAERLHSKKDSKTIGYTMHFIKKSDAVSAYIKTLPQSAAAASALSAAKDKNVVASLQARLNALRNGRSVAATLSASKKGGRRVTRRRRSRRAHTHKRR
jgi:hypothetical protein